MKVKYYPYVVKMYKGVVKITIVIWAQDKAGAEREAEEKYSGFLIMKTQAQWNYQNKLIAI